MPKLVLLFVLSVGASVAMADGTRLEFADTSSPKNTLESFLLASDVLIEQWRKEEFNSDIANHAYGQLVRTLDLSLIPNRSRKVVVMERVLLLREVLDRFDEALLWSAPELTPEQTELTHWRFSGTDLTIIKLDEGERQGQYVFSATSIQKLPGLYRTMRVLPYREPDRELSYHEFLLSPGPLLPRSIIQTLPDSFSEMYGPLPVWQWTALILVFIACRALIGVSFGLGVRWDTHFEHKGIRWKTGKIIALIGIVLLLFAARKVIDDGIWVTGGVYQFLTSVFILGQFFFMSWLIMALFNYFAMVYAFNKHNGEHVDSSLITVLARIFGGLTIVVVGIYVIEFMGYSISPILTGLGVGGLAVALAVRPVLENVINGLTLYADGGIKIGELCKYGGNLGTIESIGLRSTRIRTLERSLITIPNSEFANMEIDNLERRDKRRMEHTLRIRSELSQDQLKLLLVNLRRALLRHPMLEEEPVRVRLAGVGEFAIHVSVLAYIRCRSHEEFTAIQEDVLFMVMEQIDSVGAQLAFSNQYQFVGSLEAIDGSLKEKAANTIRMWHEANNYPFPDFSYEYKYEIKDSLIYPSRTSSIRLDASG